MRVVALGAGGFLGLSTVPALQEAGLTPTCGRRKRSNVLGLRQLKVPLVLADLDAPETIREAVKGADAVVHLAGHYPKLSLDAQATLKTATTQMRTLLDACAEGGVKRLVYISSTATVAPRSAPHGLGAERVVRREAEGGTEACLRQREATHENEPSSEADRFARAPGFGTYHDVKWHLEAQVDAEARFETVTVCPGACIGPHDYRLGTAAFLAATARQLQPPHPDGWVNVVDVRDVGLAIAKLVAHAAPPRRVILSGEPWKLHSLLELLAPRYGAPAPLPALSATDAIALADSEEHRAAKDGGRPSISRELVDLVVHGVPVSAQLSHSTLSLRYRPLSETLDAFDAWARRIGLLSTPAVPEKTA